jgi:hypothetical protein
MPLATAQALASPAFALIDVEVGGALLTCTDSLGAVPVVVTAVSLPLIPLREESGWSCTREPTKLIGNTYVYLVRMGVCGTISL